MGKQDDEGVSIPRSTICLSKEQYSQLHHQINPMTDDRNFGIIKTHGSESRGQEEACLRDEPVSYLQVAPL